MKSIRICFRVTRTLFAFAEMTNMDPGYAGPEFDFDKIIKELMIKVKQRLIFFSLFDQCPALSSISSVWTNIKIWNTFQQP